MRVLTVVVPKPGSRAGLVIAPGSGIVLDPQGEGLRRAVYFEGNLYDVEELRSYERRVFHAAGRLSAQYPTMGRGFFTAEDFIVVGEFVFAEDWSTYGLTLSCPELVEEWTA